MGEVVTKEVDLMDCYRIALDFGLPAAEKAIAMLEEDISVPEKTNWPPSD